MGKEELIKALQSSAKVDTLNKADAYIIEIEVGGMPKDQMANYLSKFVDGLNSVGLYDFVITPVSNGVGSMSFYRVKDRKLFEVE